MAFTTPDIIQWAKISQSLAVLNEAKKKALNGGTVDTDLHIKLYVERKSVEWEYNQDPASENLFQISNWLFALCGIYGLQAQYINGGSGGTVSPISPSSTDSIISPLPITSSDFASATEWAGQNSFNQPILANYQLQIFWDDAQIYLEEDVQWTRTATGFIITEPGFDSTANNYQLYVFISRS